MKCSGVRPVGSDTTPSGCVCAHSMNLAATTTPSFGKLCTSMTPMCSPSYRSRARPLLRSALLSTVGTLGWTTSVSGAAAASPFVSSAFLFFVAILPARRRTRRSAGSAIAPPPPLSSSSEKSSSG